MADCLYECLKEASLEKFHKRFCSQGLVSCDELTNLSMHDYATFGIVTMEDRLRLYQLVQIMRSVQHDDMSGNHDNLATRNSTVASSQSNMAAPSKHERNVNQNNRLNVTSEVEVRVCASKGRACEPEHGPTAVLQSEGMKNGLRKNTVVTAKEEVPATVTFRKGSDSPLFHCRKTLTFSGSDTEEDRMPLEQRSNHNNHVGVATDTSMVDAALQHQTVNDAQNAANGEHCQDHQLKNQNSSENQHKNPLLQHFQFVPLNGRHRSDVETHAYFPVSTSPPPEKITYVETILHSAGYNYGLPNVQTKSPGGTTNDTGMSKKCVERIKVCVRKRPLLAREVKQQEVDIVKMKDHHVVTVEEVKLAVDLTKFLQQHMFAFDEVFDEKCSNEDLYKNTISCLVSSIFERGSATCFAFGQTGAGKTFTLMGTKTVPGLYQLAGRDILDMVHSGRYDNNLHLWISYYEIYCGQLFDLLNKRKRLHVRENSKQKVCISGLMETEVLEAKRLVQVVHYGNSVRSKGSTGVNPTSSRSHAVLQLEVRDSRDTRVGRMSFIDLAGSERASDMTNSNKQTRMEGAEINQSLLALKECIRCIDQDSQHTPYRQSKLTHILRDSFIGNSQTVMIANISPCQSACENTLNTLRYADRVKALKKDTPPKVTRTPSNHVSAKNSKKVAPSLFHPSNIQLSSTPKVSRTRSIGSRGDTGSHGDMIDLTKVLQEAYDTPVRGHRIRVSLSERRRQQRELQKQQACGANRACVDAHNSIQSIKSFESCESGPPLVVNPSNRAEVNTSHSSSGSGSSKQGAQANGEAHQPTLVWKERRLLNSTQGKPVILRHVAEEASSPGSTSDSVQSDFLRHASRHVKSHDSTGERCLSHSDSHQRSHELSSPDQVKISPSHFSPKSNSKIFEEHKEIMLHLDSVIGRARAVMTKAASRKRIEFTSGLPSNMDAECTRDKTEHNSDALTRIEENFTDAPKSTSVRRKLAWDSDSQALYLNGSQPQNSTGFLSTAVVSLHSSALPTGGATEAANATESETDHLMLPAWATRESVIIKQSSEDLSVTSNASDISFATANSDNVKSVESLNKYNFLGDSWDNRCTKKQTWPQPSNSMMVNGAKDGDVEDSGKHMEHGSVSSAFVATDTSHQADKGQQDKDEQSSMNHDKETAITNGSSPTKGDSNDASTHSALPMGNDLLKVLEKVKTVQNQLSEEKVDQLHSVRPAYYEHFPDLLHTQANVRQPCRGFTGGTGCITTQLSTEKIIEKLDAAIEKIASETNIIKKLSPCTLRLKSSQQEGDLLRDKDQCFSVIKGNNAATQQKDGTTSVKKQSCAVNGEGEWKKDVNENFRQGSLNSSEYSPTSAQGQNCDGRSFIFSNVMPVLENITQSDGSITTTDGIKTGSGNKLAEGATGPLQSPKGKDSIGIHEGSAFSKVSDKMVKQQTDSSNSADNRPVAEALKSQKPLQNVNMNGLKYVMSPIRMEKLTGAIFSPIQCFPVTPRDNHVISIPSIVTKTLLKGHSEPVIGDTRPYETTTQLTCGSSEATQSTGDIVTNSIMTRSMLHCLVSSNIDLKGDRQQQKNDMSPVSTGMSAGDGDSGNHAKWETVKEDALHAGNSKHGVVQNVTKTGNLTTPSVQSTVDHSNIPVSAGSPNSCTAAVRDSLAMKSTDDSFDQSPHGAVKKFLQSPGSQQSSSRSSSVQSSKETALQRSQNLLVGEHEQKLAEVTTLCKQEMRLLVALRTGDKNFEDYLSILDNILLSKMAVINTLRSHIREFNNVSQTD